MSGEVGYPRTRGRGPRVVGWLGALGLLGLGTLSGCAFTPDSRAVVLEAREVGPPVLEDYRLVPGDLLEIRFFHTPELDTEILVRPDGKVSMPLAPGLQASGRTPEQLGQDLEAAYAAELVEPRVAVVVRNFTGWAVHVDGQVDQPGRIPLTHGLTLLGALAEAGGPLPSGYREQVLVIRDNEQGPHVVVSNLYKALDGSEPWQDVALHPGDRVFVPRSGIANVNNWVELYLRRNFPIDLSYGARGQL